MRSLAIFDLDGTIADTSPGIYASYRYCAEGMGVPIPEDSKISTGLGGPLPANIAKVIGIEDSDIPRAVGIYREYYTREGHSMAVPYDGIADVLTALRGAGMDVCVATLKPEGFAVPMLERWGLYGFFRSVHGADMEGSARKSDLIRMCMEDAGTDAKDTVMIGDSRDDLESARACDVGFIGAAYGFSLPESVCVSEGIPYAKSPSEIPDIVKGFN